MYRRFEMLQREAIRICVSSRSGKNTTKERLERSRLCLGLLGGGLLRCCLSSGSLLGGGGLLRRSLYCRLRCLGLGDTSGLCLAKNTGNLLLNGRGRSGGGSGGGLAGLAGVRLGLGGGGSLLGGSGLGGSGLLGGRSLLLLGCGLCLLLKVLAVAIQNEKEVLTVAVALVAALVLVAVFALVAAGFFSFSSFLGSAFLAAAGLASFFASFTVPEAPA